MIVASLCILIAVAMFVSYCIGFHIGVRAVMQAVDEDAFLQSIRRFGR